MSKDLFDVGLAVCTYKRPMGLQRLLAALPDGLDATDIPIFVIDNDGTDPRVSEVVADAASRFGLDIRVFVETEPGISAARNRALSEAYDAGLNHLAMLDDDEWPEPGWLKAMVDCRTKAGVGVVGGIVRPVFPSGREHLQRYAQFWSVLPQERDGKPFIHATSNVLIDLDVLQAVGSIRFDNDQGLSGGGDLVFFSKLFDAGVAMAWTTEGAVLEEVPAERASLNWLDRRRFRVGNHMVMDETIRQGAFKPVLKTAALWLRLPIYPLFQREPGAALTGWRLEFHKLRGRISAHLGNRVFEYARDGVGLRRHKASKSDT